MTTKQTENLALALSDALELPPPLAKSTYREVAAINVTDLYIEPSRKNTLAN